MNTAATTAPLVAHIIYRLDFGGLENGLVNLINRFPVNQYRHVIICLTESTEFRRRIRRADVEVYQLGKREGQDWGMYWRLWRLLRRLRPTIVHTRNLATLECQVPARLAGVKARVHGEHGWETTAIAPRHHQLRRWLRPLVSHYIALSQEIALYLTDRIGVRPDRVTRICNGVDAERFHPAASRASLPVADFAPPGTIVIGTVGRMQPVKDQITLVKAFIRLVATMPQVGSRLRLVLIGDGVLREQAARLLSEAGVIDQTWLPGSRDDIPDLMRAFDIFVLPSLAEGISNTILEAMACGLPVVATRVGGNA